jgi:cyanate permease
VRFFVGFLGAAAAAPVVAILHERTGSLTLVTLVLAAFSVVTLGCALFFPDRQEELRPELWNTALPVGVTPTPATQIAAE